ncbi:hypothetical protein IMG5_136650 [Ichthyophthirius multifiliis]|uniref:Transmembrane 9 superfamily member n=1 Tax=Ichthyophthirius multifiliis TaxID=5932 RepID=G0QWZ4_ICHMU|nr:hypothetical protein IMG5_136650 [Ichthyophthirius multifiliis]EGR30258.1 hypothetical protein IMG5_136650 [Ichthyophthirius multifiliis]|eukprot:XP_004031854.1 hypothetical protein IMG5_136650 [Ichthyophthirius multifiliis]
MQKQKYNINQKTQKFMEGQDLQVLVSELRSLETQLSYSFSDLEFCSTESQDQESLAEILLGEKKELIKFDMKFQKNEECKVLCNKKFNQKEIENIIWLIDRNYKYDFIIDNLPALTILKQDPDLEDELDENVQKIQGTPIGLKALQDKDFYKIYNHFNFTIEYNENTKHIVGFQVNPQFRGYQNIDNKIYSICEKLHKEDSKQQSSEYLTLDDYEKTEFFFTYSYQFKKSNKPLASRWDLYKQQDEEQVHWSSIVNSFIINSSLSLIIYVILRRILSKDISKYQEINQKNDQEDDMGWKQVKSDVFRPPGSIIGFKRPKFEHICGVNPVPLYISPQPKYLSRNFLCIIGGLLPFGSILFELSYIVDSIWNNQFYYLFGFLLLVVFLLLITCAEISILLTYLQLNNGNHKWWWNSFYCTGFCGVYVYCYCFFYWLFYLNITRLSSTLMYFGTMGIISFGIFLFCGSIGFVSSLLFVRYIYSQIKAD